MEKIAYPERFERFKKKPDPSDPTDIYKKEKGDPRFVYVAHGRPLLRDPCN